MKNEEREEKKRFQAIHLFIHNKRYEEYMEELCRSTINAKTIQPLRFYLH